MARSVADILTDDLVESIDEEIDEDEVRQRYESLVERGHIDRFLVAVLDDEIIGYIYMRWGEDETKEFVSDREAGLKEIYVDPRHWNEGVGTALYEKGISLVPDGIEAVRLEVLSENKLAQGFYESKGFEKTGETEVELGDYTYGADIYSLSFTSSHR